MRIFRIITEFLFLVALLAFSFSSFSAMAGDITPDKVSELVNRERIGNGLPILIKNENLEKAARRKLEDMLAQDYFSHNSPQGETPWKWLEAENYVYAYAGENLAMDFENASLQHKAWMKSPSHRKNILNQRYKEIGVAVGEGEIEGEKGIVTVQFFGTRQEDDNFSELELMLSNMEGLPRYSFRDEKGETLGHFEAEKFKSYSFFSAWMYEWRSVLNGESVKEKFAWVFSLISILTLTVFNSFLVAKKDSNISMASTNSVLLSLLFCVVFSVAFCCFKHRHLSVS